MQMKKLSFLFPAAIIIPLAGLYNQISAQDKRPVGHKTIATTMFGNRDTMKRKEIFTCFPTNFVASTLKLGYELRLAHNKGLKFLGSVGASSSSNDFYFLDKFTEFGLEAQLRIYVIQDHPALNGLYVAPYVSYKSMTYSGQTNQNGLVMYVGPGPVYVSNATTSDLGLGYVMGYQWVFNSTFTVDFFVGGGDNIISGNNSGGILSTSTFEYRSGIDLHTGIGIGIAF
jgi:hypothetical protein